MSRVVLVKKGNKFTSLYGHELKLGTSKKTQIKSGLTRMELDFPFQFKNASDLDLVVSPLPEYMDKHVYILGHQIMEISEKIILHVLNEGSDLTIEKDTVFANVKIYNKVRYRLATSESIKPVMSKNDVKKKKPIKTEASEKKSTKSKAKKTTKKKQTRKKKDDKSS